MGWNLEYWIGKRKIQTLITNKPKPICRAELRRLVREEPHNWKHGLFKITLSA